MAITSFQGRSTAVFKNVIKFVGGAALDGRTVVDTYSDIAGENYKSLFTFEDNGSNVASYYTGMTVVTKDTGKLYVLTNEGVFKEVTPDVLGSVSVDTYAEAVAMAGSTNIGQIVYVKTKSSYDADGEGDGAAVEYDAGPYIVIGVGALQKLAASTASGDIAGDLAALSGTVASLDEYVKAQDTILDGKINAISDKIGDSEKGLVKDIADLKAADATLDGKFAGYYTKDEADANYAGSEEFKTVKETVDNIPNVYLSKTDAASTYETKENVKLVDDKVATHTQQISDLSTNINTVSSTVDALSKNVYTKEEANAAFNIDVSNSTNEETGVKSYVIKQGTSSFSIDIPKDLMVQSGEIVDLAENEVEGKAAGAYIKLVLNTTDAAPIYISVADLIDEYTAGDNGYIDITGRKISVKYDDLKNAIIAVADGKYILADDLEGIKTGLTSDITTAYTSAIATAKQEAIDSAVESAKGYTDGIKTSLEENINTVKSDAAAATTVVDNKVSALTERVGTNEQSIVTINTNIETITTKVGTLETTVGDADNGLVKTVNTNTADIASIREAIVGSVKSVVIAGQELTADENGAITISTATSLDAEDTNAVVTLGAVKDTVNGKANVVIVSQDPDTQTLKSENVYFIGSPETGYINKVVGSDGQLHIAGDKYFVRNTDLVTDSKNGIMRAEDYTLLHSITSITTEELLKTLYPESNESNE
jgi:hypothetical protein